MSLIQTPTERPQENAHLAPRLRATGIWRTSLLVLVMIFLTLGAYFVYALQRQSEVDEAALLVSQVRAIQSTFERVVERERLLAGTASALPQVRDAFVALHDGPATSSRAAAALSTLHDRLQPIITINRNSGYALIDAGGHVVASSDSTGALGRAVAAQKEMLSRTRRGDTIVSPPILSVGNDTVPRMFVAARVSGAKGETLGTLAFGIVPALRIDRIVAAYRAEAGADAYVFDRKGIAVSNTRWGAELHTIGLVAPGRRSALRLRLADLGVDLTAHPVASDSARSAQRPLTRAVAAAISGNSGVDVHGYRDYRGVPVVGSWAWIPSLGVGVVFEVERDIALQLYFWLRRIYLTMAGGLILGNIAAIGGRRRAQRLRRLRREAEDELVRRDEVLNAIIDSSPNAVLILDDVGVVSRANTTAERHFMRPRAAIVGAPIADVIAAGVPWNGDARTFLSIAAMQAEGIRGGGTTFPADVRSSEFMTSGRLMFTVIVIDVTAWKEGEVALIAAKDLAESAARAKSDFLATRSHEIRTPMNGVLGMTSLLADTELTPEQRQYVDATKRSAQLLMSVINDILDFSKVEAGKMTIEPIPFDLESSVADVAELLVPRALEQNIEIAVKFAPNVPRRVIGDAGRIRQVMLNLAGNAVKFTRAGHVSIEVSTNPAIPDSVRFDIRDTGIGIPEDKLSTLFQPFVQVEASTTRRFGGTGLGLSISKRLVDLMGGEIGASSVSGEGSTFWFTLPLPADPDPPARLSTHAVSLADIRALIVDDIAINVQLMRAWLESWGMRVDTAPEGASALRVLQDAAAAGDPVQVAVVDYLMPVMDGEQLGRAVRADPALADSVALVLATSAAQRGDADRFSAAGFDAFLMKPLRSEMLAAALAAVLTRRTRGGAHEPIVTSHALYDVTHTGPRVSTPGGIVLATRPARRVSDAGARRVLVAEDNPVNQLVAVKMLERLGCRVDVVGDGVEAIEMSERFPYDVIFMDVQMPVVDGLEATRRIRQRERDRGRRHFIVAMTANAMAGDRERCIEAGMDDYVSKPVTPAALAAALERVTSAMMAGE